MTWAPGSTLTSSHTLSSQDMELAASFLSTQPTVLWVEVAARIHLTNVVASAVIQRPQGLPAEQLADGGPSADPRSPDLHPLWSAGLDGKGQVSLDNGICPMHVLHVAPCMCHTSLYPFGYTFSLGIRFPRHVQAIHPINPALADMTTLR